MKTAVEELIDDLLTGKITNTLANKGYYLEKEKQQIIKSFYDGCFDTNSWRAEQYYDETFKND